MSHDFSERDIQGFYIRLQGATSGLNVALRLRTWACLVSLPSTPFLNKASDFWDRGGGAWVCGIRKRRICASRVDQVTVTPVDP